MLTFHEDAIELSGETGTKLKSEIIGKYYPLWWNITSGGKSPEYSKPTAIIEMNAGTGEDYIKDTDTTILGSSGHALKLKAEDPNTSHLEVILIESDSLCFSHLKNVVARRWPMLEYSTQVNENSKDVCLLNIKTNIPDIMEQINLGNSLFFFDPLLYSSWSEIEEIASKRIKKYYQTGTEFIIFLFSSDWFQGRGDLVPLPTNSIEENWSFQEKNSVSKMDDLFGHNRWHSDLLVFKSPEERMEILVKLYRERLHKWFRYVLPLPFQPKHSQIYHLFMCSNYEVGVRITKDFYSKYTNNPKYSPDNDSTHSKFVKVHPELRMRGNKKSFQWKTLWKIIREHEEGICDMRCLDLIKELEDFELIRHSLEWLESYGYIIKINDLTDAWDEKPHLYKLDWNFLKERLGVDSPMSLKPLSSMTIPPPPEKNTEKEPQGLDRFF